MKKNIKCGLVLLVMLIALSVGVAFGEKNTDASKKNSVIIDSVTFSPSVKYVEIKNNGNSEQDLTGWVLQVQNKTTFTFPKFALDANARVKVHSGTGTDSKTDLYATGSLLNKSSDEVSLLDANGNIVSSGKA